MTTWASDSSTSVLIPMLVCMAVSDYEDMTLISSLHSPDSMTDIKKTVILKTGFCLGDIEWWSKFSLQDTSVG